MNSSPPRTWRERMMDPVYVAMLRRKTTAEKLDTMAEIYAAAVGIVGRRIASEQPALDAKALKREAGRALTFMSDEEAEAVQGEIERGGFYERLFERFSAQR